MSARNFTALWAGTAVTNLADGVVKLTLPLVAVSMTDSPALVAGTTLANTLPWLLFALPAGALADRVDRRCLIIRMAAARALVLAVLVVGILADMLPLAGLYAGALLLGTAEVFADTTRMSIVPMVIPRNRMESAFAKLTATETAANEFIGPPLGGLLAAAGLAVALGAGGVGYAGALLALAVMTGHYRSDGHRRSATNAPGLRADIREGIRYVWQARILRTLLLVAGAASGCWAAWMAVIVVYAVAPGPMDLSRSEYGLLIGALGMGGVLGAAAAPALTRRLGRRVVLAASMAGFAVLLATPAFSSSPRLIAVTTFLGGAGSGAWNVTYSSLRALVVPDEMMGRYSGVSRLTSWGSMPLGALLAGLTAELVSVRAVFWGGAALCALVLAATLRTVTSPEFRQMEARATASQEAAL
ncbi:MFS transporter [Micromonospora parathelypteridis]|uniref:MFS family permease n=1 Tax=Micromonospora parathelypteridis TaxID=1839617 RepID=A0A840VWS1_9ACTN|nr:MFS transporter [Micromonospora parathelypteridis]MBB5475511.1 MFS family permease [Micromonospora parathelypteridis]